MRYGKSHTKLEIISTLMKMELLEILDKYPAMDRRLLVDASCTALKRAMDKKGYQLRSPIKRK